MLTLYLNLFLSARISSEDSQSSSLFLIHLNYVILFHLESLRGLIIIDTSPVEQKPQGCNGDTNPLGVRLLEFAHLSGLLHPEVDFIGILSNHLQFDVFIIISSSPSLFLVNLNDIVLFHLQGFGIFIIIDPSSIKEKSERYDWDSNPLGVGFLEFAHLGGLLHSEVNFIGVLSDDLELDVFRVITGTSGLLLVNLDDIILFHLEGLWVFIIIDPPSIKEKAERCDWHSDPLGVRLLQFAHLGSLLYSEVNFIGVLSN